ncbi:outer membrane beta-barrel family protein [Rufibacter latericius]|uniref:TonB-dependent receptor n=1 Tax=Rufibacter latericius TaxID=2487040 RepID=A0A3M9MKQ2_9BACT|nr:outer membrane beta-barrel family protein [Rufibacter latericius]RNI25787.1 TonB-dependent receptor [Rufibacter latericius]
MRLSILASLFFLCLIISSPLQAQSQSLAGKISGQVLDSLTTKPVAFGTVTLTSTATGKPIDGTITDEKGSFSFSKVAYGAYSISVSYLGYVTSSLPSFTISADKQEIILPHLSLRSNVTKLQEVTVVGQKALIEDKGDRLVYNAEQDISNQGTTASEVLRKVPSVTVDGDGNVQLRGSANFKVLMDGKPSSILANNLADALKQIPADIIKSIEVITSPSAKYDAEGTAGIINITTKKNSLQGVNGKASLSLGNRYRNVNGSLNVKKAKFGLSTTLSGYDNNQRRLNVVNRTNDGELTLQQESRNLSLNHGFYVKAELTFDPDTLNAFHLGVSTRRNYFSGSGYQTTLNRGAGSDQLPVAYSDLKNPWNGGGYDMNFGYTRTFKPKQELTFLAQLNHNESNDLYDNLLYSPEAPLVQRQKNDNTAPSEEKTLQLDYTQTFKNGSKLELGAKAIFRDASSRTTYTYAFPTQADSTNLNNFDYDQDVKAAYATYGFQLKKFDVNLGTRYEHTNTKGVFLNSQWDEAAQETQLVRSTFKDAYQNVIPSLSISRTIDTIHTVRVSYTQRIQRPQIYSLNPFLQLEDFNFGYRGNPTLDAELTHAYEIGYNTYFKTTSINASVFLRQTDNSIQQVVAPEQLVVNDQLREVMLITHDNIGKNKVYGLSLSGATKPLAAWTISPSLNLNYVVLEDKSQKREGLQYNLNLSTSYEFGKGLTAQANAGYNSKSKMLQVNIGENYYAGFSVRKKVMKDKGSVSFGVNNPFSSTINFKYTVVTPGYQQTAQNINFNRTFRIGFDWTFGKMQASQKQKKTIENDDVLSGGK